MTPKLPDALSSEHAIELHAATEALDETKLSFDEARIAHEAAVIKARRLHKVVARHYQMQQGDVIDFADGGKTAKIVRGAEAAKARQQMAAARPK